MRPISIRPTTNMTINHDTLATFCEIRNCVIISLGMASHTVSTGQWVYKYGFDEAY